MAVERKFVQEAVSRLLVRDFVKKETSRAGFGGLDIQRTPLGTRVNIIAERPGMVIGRRGVTINALTARLDNEFHLENPQLSVEEPDDNPALNAQVMAFKVAESLERGWHFRRVGHSTVQRIMGAGAKGCIVEIAGKVTGQRKRREKFIAGHIKYCGETAVELMESGYAQCKKKLGTIGCTVRIMKKDAVLPDNVRIYEPGEKQREAVQKQAAAAAKAAGVETVKDAPAEPAQGEGKPDRKRGDKPGAAKPGDGDSSEATAGADAKAEAKKDDEGKDAKGGRQRKSFTVPGGDS